MHRSRRTAAASAAFLLAAAAALPQPARAGAIVGFSGNYSAGTVVVKTHERSLYLVLGNGKAMRYPVGVGKAGMAWHGTAYVARKLVRPSWGPPEDIWRANPNLPAVIPRTPDQPARAAPRSRTTAREELLQEIRVLLQRDVIGAFNSLLDGEPGAMNGKIEGLVDRVISTNSFAVTRVSSQAIASHRASVSAARFVTSPRLPIGVATI